MGLDMGNGGCRVHGGGKGAQWGISNPNYKTGKYSKVLSKNLIPDYDKARTNPEYLKLNDEIALVDARLVNLLASVEGKSSSLIFSNLSSVVSKIERSQRAIVRARNISDEEQRQKALENANIDYLDAVTEVVRLIKTGSKEWYIWEDITELIERRRRLVETERKLLVDMQMLVHTQDVIVLLDAVMESVRRNVTDRSIRQSIQSDFVRLTAK